MREILLDTSVVVGGHDVRDVHHAQATAMLRALDEGSRKQGLRLVTPDCVVVEAIGVLCRRRAERREKGPLQDFRALFPKGKTAPVYRLLETAWDEVLERVGNSGGRLNAHDALLTVFASRRKIEFIATFDADFAETGLQVLKSAEEVQAIT